MTNGAFNFIRPGYECDNDDDAIYFGVSCRDQYGNECTLPPASAPINLALGKDATQACDFLNAPSLVASRAVDGKLNTAFHTGDECKDQPWWSVDLGAIKEIQQIKIYNRLIRGACQKENCQDRLRNFYIRLYESDPEDSDPVVATAYYQEDPIGDELTFVFNGAIARWVRIELQDTNTYLHLREVEVMGWDLPINLALNKVARQKCTLSNADDLCIANGGSCGAGNAVDGKINGPFSHTVNNCIDQPWWDVDLGDIKEIEQVKIYNRLVNNNETDPLRCYQDCQDRLQNFTIRLYETDPEDTNPVLVDEIYQNRTIGDYRAFNFNGAKGRWVRIQLRGKAFLSLREVEVMGWDIAPTDTRRRSLFAIPNATHDESENPEINGTDTINNTYARDAPPEESYNNQTDNLQPPPTPAIPVLNCQTKSLTFTYNVTYAKGNDPAAIKEITKFIEGRNGIQTDLYGELGTDQIELSFGSELIVNTTKTTKLCSNDGVYEGLNIIELENTAFNEAFDAFSEDLVISDSNANNEAECQQVREFLGFEPDYIDDYEICREFEGIKCDYNQGGEDNPVFDNANAERGGQIPDFEGFEFKEQSFEGFEYEGSVFTEFEFEGSEFVGFEFAGFEASADLIFQEVQKAELTKFDEIKSGEYVSVARSCIRLYFCNLLTASLIPFLICMAGGKDKKKRNEGKAIRLSFKTLEKGTAIAKNKIKSLSSK